MFNGKHMFENLVFNLGLAQQFVSFRVSGKPVVANYDITGKCNQKCEHCYFYRSYDHGTELSDDEWAKVFRAHRNNGISTAVLTGGEPTLRPAVIGCADEIFENLLIVSNGMIKVKPNIQRRVFVSIDGIGKTHDKIRGIKCFDRVIKNISGDERVVVASTLSTSNYGEIEDLVSAAKEAGVRGITFSMYSPRSLEDPLMVKGDYLAAAISKLQKCLKENKGFVLISPRIIQTFLTKEHVKKCYLKEKWVASYYPDLREKKPCVLGEGILCEACACIIPVSMYCVRRFDLESARVVRELFTFKQEQKQHVQ